MKQVKFLATISVAAIAMLLSACESGGEKKSDEAVTDTSAVKTDTSTVKTETTPAPADVRVTDSINTEGKDEKSGSKRASRDRLP